MSDSQMYQLGPLANEGKGWCLLCNEEVDQDVAAHFAERHKAPDFKPKVDILAWPDRVDKIIDVLKQMKEGDNPRDQMASLDDALQDLYLVRVRLGEKLRDQNRKGR